MERKNTNHGSLTENHLCMAHPSPKRAHHQVDEAKEPKIGSVDVQERGPLTFHTHINSQPESLLPAGRQTLSVKKSSSWMTKIEKIGIVGKKR